MWVVSQSTHSIGKNYKKQWYNFLKNSLMTNECFEFYGTKKNSWLENRKVAEDNSYVESYIVNN